MIQTEANRTTRSETRPIATLSTTNLTWNAPVLKPGQRLAGDQPPEPWRGSLNTKRDLKYI